jgi:large subunit ribosomal protein L35
MKQRTHSSTKKRVKITGTGKIMMQRSCKNHLLSSKSKRQLKLNRLGQEIDASRKKTFSRLLAGAL